MTENKTFTIIKPTAVKNNYIGPILAKINEANFKIIALKYLKMTEEQAKAFYKVHEERGFYSELVNYMSSGPVVVAILEKDKVRRLKRYEKHLEPSQNRGLLQQQFLSPMHQ